MRSTKGTLSEVSEPGASGYCGSEPNHRFTREDASVACAAAATPANDSASGIGEAVDLRDVSFAANDGAARVAAARLPQSALESGRVAVRDASGALFACDVRRLEDGDAELSVGSLDRPKAQASVAITLFTDAETAASASEAFAMAAELGASEIAVYGAALDDAMFGETLERLGRRCAKAAVLAGRKPARVFAEREGASAVLSRFDAGVLFWEGAKDLADAERTVRSAIAAAEGRTASIALIIGPKSGVAPDRAAALESAGIELRSLGARLLRPETAMVMGVSLFANAAERAGASLA